MSGEKVGKGPAERRCWVPGDSIHHIRTKRRGFFPKAAYKAPCLCVRGRRTGDFRTKNDKGRTGMLFGVWLCPHLGR
jgi:hypothetical protein